MTWRFYYELTNKDGDVEVCSEYADSAGQAERQARKRLRGTGCRFDRVVERADGMRPLFDEIMRAAE